MPTNPIVTSVIRTVVPLIVGLVATFCAKWGFDIDNESLTAILTTVFSAVYYAVVRAIEEKKPRAGRFLGVAKKPTY